MMLAVFSNRTETLMLYKILQSNNIPSQVINTPNKAKFSCSISVKFPKQFYSLVVTAIKKYNLSSFVRFANYF